MDKLLAYINSLPADEQAAYAACCETTVGYLRKACSKKQLLGVDLVARLSAESGKVVRPEDVRPDLDWEYMRLALDSTAQALANTTQPASETMAPPVQPIQDAEPHSTDPVRIGGQRRQGGRRQQFLMVKGM